MFKTLSSENYNQDYPHANRIYIKIKNARRFDSSQIPEYRIDGDGVDFGNKDQYHFSILEPGNGYDAEEILGSWRYNYLGEEWGVLSDDFRERELMRHSDLPVLNFCMAYYKNNFYTFRTDEIKSIFDNKKEEDGKYQKLLERNKNSVREELDITPEGIKKLMGNKDILNKKLRDIRRYSREKSRNPLQLFEDTLMFNPVITLDLHGFTADGAERTIEWLENVMIQCNIPLSKVIYGKSGSTLSSLTHDFLGKSNILVYKRWNEGHCIIKNKDSTLDDDIAKKISQRRENLVTETYDNVREREKELFVTVEEALEHTDPHLESSF